MNIFLNFNKTTVTLTSFYSKLKYLEFSLIVYRRTLYIIHHKTYTIFFDIMQYFSGRGVNIHLPLQNIQVGNKVESIQISVSSNSNRHEYMQYVV